MNCKCKSCHIVEGYGWIWVWGNSLRDAPGKKLPHTHTYVYIYIHTSIIKYIYIYTMCWVWLNHLVCLLSTIHRCCHAIWIGSLESSWVIHNENWTGAVAVSRVRLGEPGSASGENNSSQSISDFASTALETHRSPPANISSSKEYEITWNSCSSLIDWKSVPKTFSLGSCRSSEINALLCKWSKLHYLCLQVYLSLPGNQCFKKHAVAIWL